MLKKFFVVVILVLTLGFGWLSKTYAEKPEVVVSISQLDQFQKSLLNAVQKIDPQSAMMVQIFLAPGGPIIPPGMGVDAPLGIVGNVSGGAPDIVAFGPASNFKMLEAWFKAAKDSGRFTDSIVLKENGKRFVCQEEKSTIALPANPVELLGDLPAKYLLAVDLSPAAMAEQLAVLSQMLPQAGDNVEKFQTSLSECEHLRLGLNIDSKGDIQLTIFSKATPGSDAEKQLQKAVSAKSMLGGFYEADADAAFHVICGTPPALRQILEEQIEQNSSSPAVPLLRSLMACDILEAAGSFDVEDNEIEMVLAFTVTNGKVLKSDFQKIVEADENVTAEWDVDKVGKSISIHRLDFGKFQMAIGMHSKFIFIAVEKEDAVETLKETIVKTLKTKKSKMLFRGHFDMDLAAGIPQAAGFGDLDGKVTITSTSSTAMINLENEFLKSILTIVKNAQAAQTVEMDGDDIFIEEDDDDDVIEIELDEE